MAARKGHRLVLMILGVPAVLIAGILLAGTLLPKEHTAVSRAVLAQPREAVWAVVSDFAGYPAWRDDVNAMVPLPDGSGWEEQPTGIAYRVLEETPPSRLVTEIVPGLPFGGTLTIELDSKGEGTVLTLVERGKIESPLFRFVARFVFGHHSAVDGYLRSLGRRFGEDPVPEHDPAD